MSYSVVTREPDDRTLNEWNEFLNATRFPTQYTSPAIFQEPYFAGRQPFAILARDGDAVTGVLTGLVNGREISCGTPASPQLCLRDGADRDLTGAALVEGLISVAPESTQFISAFAWEMNTAFGAAGFRGRVVDVPLCTIILDLAKGKEQLMRECSETRRNKIRRAIKAGVQVESMNLERDFAEYYDLYRDWCAFKSVTCHPYEVQRAVLANTDNRLVLVARHLGRLIGVSTFRFRRPGIVEYASNISRREQTKVRQNDLLLWRGIEWAVDQKGFREFSMAGSHFFLQKFGGSVTRTYRYTLDRTIFRRHHTADDVRLGLLRAYKSLPASIQSRVKRFLGRSGEAD